MHVIHPALLLHPYLFLHLYHPLSSTVPPVPCSACLRLRSVAVHECLSEACAHRHCRPDQSSHPHRYDDNQSDRKKKRNRKKKTMKKMKMEQEKEIAAVMKQEMD